MAGAWLRQEQAELAADRILDAAADAFVELGVSRTGMGDASDNGASMLACIDVCMVRKSRPILAVLPSSQPALLEPLRPRLIKVVRMIR